MLKKNGFFVGLVHFSTTNNVMQLWMRCTLCWDIYDQFCYSLTAFATYSVCIFCINTVVFSTFITVAACFFSFSKMFFFVISFTEITYDYQQQNNRVAQTPHELAIYVCIMHIAHLYKLFSSVFYLNTNYCMALNITMLCRVDIENTQTA